MSPSVKKILAEIKDICPEIIVSRKLPNSAYIHIPFCRRRCYYCDFPISVLGNKTNSDTSISVAEYVEVLCKEINLSPLLGKPLETVFFGGGTPSLLPVKYLETILLSLDKKFGISTNAEISIEMDPGTFDWEKVQGYQQNGINRISLGVQAFQDELLKICGRSHSVNDILTAIDLIHNVSISNFSLDLISGLPNQTIYQWQESIEKAISFSPQHISCYDLVVEPVTAFGKQYQPGEKPLPTDEITASMYKLAQNLLTTAGYQHYEISNYAQPGYQCRHNQVYWQNLPYYAFGMGAASYTNKQRFTRPRTRKDYYEWVQAGALITVEEITQRDYLLETLMLGLRMAEGISLSKIKQEFGKKILQVINDCLEPYYFQGWVEITDNNLRLTDPEGFLFSNTVLSSLFSKLDLD